MLRYIALLSIFTFATLLLPAQNNLLRSGPMVGYSEMMEVMLWVQTTEAAQVSIAYHPQGQPAETHWTNTVNTEKTAGFTAHLLADTLQTGRVYDYQLYINGQRVDFPYPTTFQTRQVRVRLDEAPDFSLITGSGGYINEARFEYEDDLYGGEYQIFEAMAESSADFMIWLGDNVYYHEPDWSTRTGMIHRNSFSRQIPEKQKLLATMHHYAIWDDHDYGPNNSDRSFWNKNTTLEVFKLFWANPTYGVGNTPGAFTFFQWYDVDFFLLDNRFYRDNNERSGNNKTMLGEAQLQWLFDALSYSRARYKMVVMGGQFLNPAGVFETYSNYGFANERQRIIEFIHNEQVENVVFLTGDRHHSEISVLKRKDYPTIYDITVSPFTSRPSHSGANEVNTLRVEGSLIHERNYARLSFRGTKDNRQLYIEFFDSDGNPLFNYTIE